MSKKFVMILLAVLALTLNACTRAASVTVGTPTPDVNFPQPMATSAMNAIEIAGTQTAVTTAGLPIPPAAGTDTTSQTGTNMPSVDATFTPLAPVNLTPDSTSPTSTPNVNVTLPSPTSQITAVNTTVPGTAVPVVKPGTYTLKEGEFVWCIARRFNVDPQEVLALNGLSAGQLLSPGLSLTIPTTNHTFPGTRSLKAHPAQYTVRAGDTIYSIACAFGDVNPSQIITNNNLSGSYNLTVGSTLQIP